MNCLDEIVLEKREPVEKETAFFSCVEKEGNNNSCTDEAMKITTFLYGSCAFDSLGI